MCVEIHPIYSNYIQRIIREIHVKAYKTAFLGNNMGSENKSISEIYQEGKELIMTALLTAIRRYGPDYEVSTYDTPDNLYVYLWRLFYEYIRSQKNHNSFVLLSINEIQKQIKDFFRDELKLISDFIDHEYDRRLYEFETKKEEQR
jgi:hypothetical protein